ncbi:hypothetical protein PoB_006229000 [Plakobranchus ocellatus]|uniref:Uncharacterized protein n=1 Tax=Plakobranchus ocellatus TaxID=259542 RepID=A0AAV4CV86_9GAST|nr:hypothetical protein PoB_006229000 [Plakobranchus ocellatus]
MPSIVVNNVIHMSRFISPVHNKVVSGFQALCQVRTRNGRVPADLRADSLATVPSTSPASADAEIRECFETERQTQIKKGDDRWRERKRLETLTLGIEKESIKGKKEKEKWNMLRGRNNNSVCKRKWN